MQNEPITEDWLREVGFKYHQLERQPDKHWLLWLGRAIDDHMTSADDIGIEVAPCGHDDEWFCWLRSDACHRYHRFIHLRHIKMRGELVAIFTGITGRFWNPDLHIYGMAHSQRSAEWIARDRQRLDLLLLEGGPAWYEAEKDPDRGRPLVEHMDAAIKSGGAK